MRQTWVGVEETVVDGERESTVLGDVGRGLSLGPVGPGGRGAGTRAKRAAVAYSTVNYANYRTDTFIVTNPLATNQSRVSLKSRTFEGHIFSETAANPHLV